MDKFLPCPLCGAPASDMGGGHCCCSNDECALCEMGNMMSIHRDEWNTRHTPEGWQLVPVEADDSMRQAFNDQHDLPYNPASEREYRPIHTWRRMLSAAPKWGGE